MKKFYLYFSLSAFLLLALQGCGGLPKDALSMNRMTLEEKQLQTRVFDTTDEGKILAASVEVLQELGFHLDESETDLGLIVGSKDPDATKAGHVLLAAILAGLNDIPATYSQKIRITVVSSPAGEKAKGISVRVTFQRIVWDHYGRLSKLERLNMPELYQGFFDKLCKAIFPEEQGRGGKSSRSQVLNARENQGKRINTQSRIFDITDKVKTLQAVMTTLQDLGFGIGQADDVLGIVSATKLDNYAVRIIVNVRSHGETQMHVLASARYNLKAIEDPKFYQQFFAALDKAIIRKP